MLAAEDRGKREGRYLAIVRKVSAGVVGKFLGVPVTPFVVFGIGSVTLARNVRRRDLNGNAHVIPHSSMDSVINYSKELSRSVMDTGAVCREDIDEGSGRG